MAEYSTAQVARELQIGRDTLHRWLNEGLRKPAKLKIGGVSVRIWTEKDLQRAREYKTKRYHKGRGRKAKANGKTVEGCLESVKREFPELSHSHQRAIARTRALKEKLKVPIVKE
jgi:DNA-binding transcriptional MerR regulator